MRSPRQEATHQLIPGDCLVLFSDGLVESRTVDIDKGLERLRRAAVVAANWPLDRLCEHVLGELTRGDSNEDDVTLLALRIPGTGG